MKKNLFFYLFAVLCTVSLFTSCSDDDEPTVTVPGNVDVAGDYKGALDVTLKMELEMFLLVVFLHSLFL